MMSNFTYVANGVRFGSYSIPGKQESLREEMRYHRSMLRAALRMRRFDATDYWGSDEEIRICWGNYRRAVFFIQR